MEYTNIIFIGGFGASTKYSKKMCMELQRITGYKVYNFCLFHGLSLEEECKNILYKLQKKDICCFHRSYIIMGFSTGCLVAMKLSKVLKTYQIIILNPAEILTRININILESIISPKDYKKYRNIITYTPIIQKQHNNYSIIKWNICWFIFNWIWWSAITFLGPSIIAKLYYKYFGKGFHEPRPNELQRQLFRQGRKLEDVKKTLIECILKPSLYEMILCAKIRIQIVQGKDDKLYIPYVHSLFFYNKNVTLHRTDGDHHMIYHLPIETAQKISALVKLKTIYDFY